MFVLHKTRSEFHSHAQVTDAAEQQQLILIAETQLDNLTAQVVHMRELLNKDMLVHTAGMKEWSKDETATVRLEEQQKKAEQERRRQRAQQQYKEKQRQKEKQTNTVDSSTLSSAATTPSSVSGK